MIAGNRSWGVSGLLMLLALGVVVEPAFAQEKAAAPKSLRVYVGTYTNAKSKGIYLCELDLASGKLSNPEVAAEVANPSFLAIHPSRNYLYAVGEINNFENKKTGAVTSFAIDRKTGKLTQINQRSSQGAGPCHVVVSASGNYAFVANYTGGTVAALPIQDGGGLGDATSFIQHKGSSVNTKRQGEPHAHSINLDAANRFAFAADLGCDKVFVYRFDPSKGLLTPNDPPAAILAPGSGPRHFAFHPSGKYAYVINEILLTVTAFQYDAEKGVLTEIQTISTVPAGTSGGGLSTAEVQVHPSGKFVYGSNRGHDTLAIYSVDANTGKLTAVGHQSTGGKTPRNFGIDPTGAYVLAANQGSDNITVFRVDATTGKLNPTGQSVEVPVPVCVKFLVP